VFAGEVVIVAVILVLARRMADTPPEPGARLDLGGTALSAAGLGLVVYGILRAGSWGFVNPKPDAPSLFGLSAAIWLVLAGGVVVWVFLAWERHRITAGEAVLIDPEMLENKLLRGGLTSFFFQYLLQAGMFFVVPLFLSVALGLTAVETGVRILPLSVALLVTAVGIPKFFPLANPRRVVRSGFLLLLAGLVSLAAALDAGVEAEVVTGPLLLAGLGVGALASQLGSVTVSAVPDEQSAEVGGLQNTVTNLGASIGTALSGAVLISALTTSFLTGIEDNDAVPQEVTAQADENLAAGAPFISNADLETALEDAGVSGETKSAIMEQNEESRLDGLRAALLALGVLALLALLTSGGIPTRQPGAKHPQRSP
jgi:hypothetical protein